MQNLTLRQLDYALAIARHGHIAYQKSFGSMDLERNKPMADDAIFRIYSMTKPITSVALMTLYEKGYFQLNDPVSRYVPPDTFKMYEQAAYDMGFTHAAVGAMVRSSYHADQQAHAAGV